jgi:hypothetical protein
MFPRGCLSRELWRTTVRRKTGLLMIGFGAVLSFAVTARTSAFDPRAAGYLIIMAGVLSMVIPRRSPARMRHGKLVRYYYRQTPPSAAAKRADDQAAQ